MDDLTLAISEYVKKRALEGETDVSLIHREIMCAVDFYLEDASINESIDTSRYKRKQE
jgi:hypothetical protein